MTASGYRRRQRRKGYPRKLTARDFGHSPLVSFRVLTPEDVVTRYPMLRDFRGRAG